MSPHRTAALVAGILYLSTHVTSVAAVAVYGDGSSASGIVGGVALEILLALGVLGTGVVLLPLLSPAAPILANTFSALRTMEAAVIAAGTLSMIALLTTGTDAAPLGALHDAAFLVGQGFVISVNTLVIATLLVRTGVVPRWIGVLGIVGGALVLFGNAGQLFGWFDRASVWAAVAAGPVFVFEISFAVFLIARGLRAPRVAGPDYAARQQPAT
jgi:hypothetical protein